MADLHSIDVTGLLSQWSRGDRLAAEALAEAVYPKLRALARRALRKESPGITYQSSDLVNEAFVRLQSLNQVHWQSREHLYALASLMMRRILVDHARARRGPRRGGDWIKVELVDGVLVAAEPRLDLLALDDALTKLEAAYPRPAMVATMRYFGGMSGKEVAAALGCSLSTTEKDVAFALAWLRREMARA